MKKATILISAAILSSSFMGAYAQKLAAEKTIEVSERKERGYLGNVIADDTKQQLDLVYVTKTTNKKIKFKAYQFDYDLNLINEFADEQDVEKAKGKYNWFNFRGNDVEVVTGIIAKASMGGKAVFQKKETTYTYSWLTGRYYKKVKTLETLKPKTDQGKMYFFAGYDLDVTGEAMAFVGQKGEKMADFASPYMNFRILKVNSELDMISDEALVFDKIQILLWNGPIENNTGDTDNSDWGILLAPQKMAGIKNETSDTPLRYTFVRIGRDGKVKNRIEFETKSYEWQVNGAVEKDGVVMLYGPGMNKNLEKSFMDFKGVMSSTTRVKGFECFQIAGFQKGAVKFVSAANMDQFELLNRKPADQKKPSIYSGGKLRISGIDITSNNDIFISGQEFANDLVAQGLNYNDFHVFHFNSSGVLQNAFGIDNPQKGGIKGIADPLTDPKQAPTSTSVFEGTNPTDVYWMTLFIAKIDKVVTSDANYEYTSYHPRLQPRLGKMNLTDGTIGSMMIFGGEDTYLYEDNPTVKINGGKQTVFLGEHKSGKQIWLGKFDPAKL